MKDYLISPNPKDKLLTEKISGIDHEGAHNKLSVTVERPLTLFLNGQEIVTMMTIGDFPDCLAVGFLLNQNMLSSQDKITAIDYDAEIDTVVVRTARGTNYEEKLKKKTRTSGCAMGTVFGDVMEKFDEIVLDPDARIRTSWLYSLSKKINSTPSLYLEAGAIHGCVLCEGNRPMIYMEDVGRHNAFDKLIGAMWRRGWTWDGGFALLSSRCSYELVEKAVLADCPLLVTISAPTRLAAERAAGAGLALVALARADSILLFGEGGLDLDQ